MQTFDIYNCTAQEACDYAMKKLVAQGAPCIDQGNCLYSDGHGKHCAIGWLIDPNYSDLMQHKGAFDSLLELYVDNDIKIPPVFLEEKRVFRYLQQIHDVADTYRGQRRLDQYDEELGWLEQSGINVDEQHWKEWRKILETYV